MVTRRKICPYDFIEERQADRQTDRQTDRQSYRQTYRQADGPTVIERENKGEQKRNFVCQKLSHFFIKKANCMSIFLYDDI